MITVKAHRSKAILNTYMSFTAIALPRDNPDSLHHWTDIYSYKQKVEWWDAATACTDWHEEGRCSRCWLRNYDCYCSINIEPDVYIHSKSPTTATATCSPVRICMYYHFSELGRSANTAHFLNMILPASIPIDTIVYGDEEKERVLLAEMAEEAASGIINTVVLYPSNDAIELPTWIHNRLLLIASASKNNKDNDSNSSIDSNSNAMKSIRIVALEGTYPQAERQYKFLKKSLLSLYSLPLPVVKLYFDDGKCMSMMTGLMNQVSKEKICTLQATVLAMKDIGVSETLCSSLLSKFKMWIKYLIDKQIKRGKNKVKQIKGIDEKDMKFEQCIQDHLQSSPPPATEAEAKRLKYERLYQKYLQSQLNNIINSDSYFVPLYIIKTKRFGILSLNRQ